MEESKRMTITAEVAANITQLRFGEQFPEDDVSADANPKPQTQMTMDAKAM